MIITIDGPTASGKGSIAKALASQYAFFYLDTGLLYRSIGYLAHKEFTQEQVVKGDLWTDAVIAAYTEKIQYVYQDGQACIVIEGVDCTAQLRTPLIDWYASHVSSVPVVRHGLRALQRSLAQKHDIVIDGRDCGTVLFPHADYKFFITASLPVRVARAHADTARRAAGMSLADCEQAVLLRDMRDILRPISPLLPAPDAIILDTSSLGLEACVALVSFYITPPIKA